MQDLEDKLLSGEYGVYSLNEDFYKSLKKDYKRLKNQDVKLLLNSKQETIKSKLGKLKNEISVLEQIKSYCDEIGQQMDLIIITQKQFKSGIYKPAFQELPIRFCRDKNIILPMKDVSSVPFDLKEEVKPFFICIVSNQISNLML